jgi:hypothetical protein
MSNKPGKDLAVLDANVLYGNSVRDVLLMDSKILH